MHRCCNSTPKPPPKNTNDRDTRDEQDQNMMTTASENAAPPGRGRTIPAEPEPGEEARSKDAFFVRVAELAEAMIAAHGRDFAIGTLVLAAKFIAEGKPLTARGNGGGETASTAGSG
jgi:hypothetical protein